MPNSRDLDGHKISFSGTQIITVRVLTFNNPGKVTGVRWAWESDIHETKSIAMSCQSPDQLKECIQYVTLTLDANAASKSGLHELRLSPDIAHNDLGKRHFATLNYQMFLKNGKPASAASRSATDPIGRSWYTGFDYVNESVNYLDLFQGLESIPTVSGVVPLKIRHSEGTHSVTSYLFQDPSFHMCPKCHEDPSQDPTGLTKLLYKKNGRFDGSFSWNTCTVSNGAHILYIQTEDSGAEGVHASALLLRFNVENIKGKNGC